MRYPIGVAPPLTGAPAVQLRVSGAEYDKVVVYRLAPLIVGDVTGLIVGLTVYAVGRPARLLNSTSLADCKAKLLTAPPNGTRVSI
jgi:hypothetical protein